MKKLFHNAKFYSLDKSKTIFDSVLTEDGIIIDCFLGTPKIVAKKIDLNGSFVYPGFIDTHTHSFEGGLYSLAVDASKADKIADLLDLLAEAPKIGGMIFAYNFDENNILEQRFPLLKEIDKIFPDFPFLLRRIDGHSCLINSFAFEKITWGKNIPIGFDGVLRKTHNDIVAHWFHRNLDNESIIQAYEKAATIAIEGGFTTIHTMIGDADNDALHFELINNYKKNLPIEYILYPQIFNIGKALELGSNRIGGCILADGSFGSYTAAISKPYANKPTEKGILYQSQSFWNKFVEEAHNNDLQVAIHAIGDAAISQILSAYEKAQVKNPKNLYHQIIHNELNTDDMIERMQVAKVSAVMQPMFDRLWGGKNGFYRKVLGNDRAKKCNRLRTIYNKNILLTGGSDWYITELNATKELHAAINIHNENERLSSSQAVELFTINAAKLSNDSSRLGKIQKNYQADFTCFESEISDSFKENTKISHVIKKGILLK